MKELLSSVPFCNYGFGMCNITCLRWQGIFYELNWSPVQLAFHYTPKAKSNFSICNERSSKFEVLD